MPQSAFSRRESRKAMRAEIERRRDVMVTAMMLLHQADEAVSSGAYVSARLAIEEVDRIVREMA